MNAEIRFREMFNDSDPAIAQYARQRGHQQADANDLVAATFEIAWRRLDKVSAGEEALPWLLTVARNLRATRVVGLRVS